MKKCMPFLMLLIAFLLSAEASARALVSISIQAEKEIKINNVTKKVAADSVNPGDVIFYTLHYANSGDEDATSAVIDDPIPKGTVYIPGSAFGTDADITFSIDNGKTFKKPALLTYEVRLPDGKTEIRNVAPEKYTHIRWTLRAIPPRGSGQAGFQARVK